jgi:hypothetical protein
MAPVILLRPGPYRFLNKRSGASMPFNPRRAFKIQVAGYATVVLSVAAVVVVVFSVWWK